MFRLIIAIGVLASHPAWALSAKSNHTVGLALAAGFPQLLAGEVRLTSIPNFEFGSGFGAFPINGLAQSLYTFAPVPMDLQTSDTFNLYPSGSYSLSGLYAFVRWFPWESSFFLHLGIHSVNFTAQLSGTLKNETQGTSVPGALTGTVTVTQLILSFGPGYQFQLSDHFQTDFGLGALFLLPASSATSTGGSASGFVVLNAQAQANYDAAKRNVANSVNQAMSNYQASVKILPSLYFTLSYLF